ncbi:lipopolysaccharide biosynthesis protein [Desulfovulcanus sp.]
MHQKTDKPSLTQQAGQGALWQIMGGGWQTVVRLGASTILARNLDPSDFGLFGMALLASELIMVLTNLGMGTGIVAKKEVSEKDLNTCFWTMAGVRIVMFIIAEFCAPLAALFFKDPRVTDVIRVVGFNFLFSIPSVVSNTLLIKDLRFKAIVLVRGIGALLESSLAVYLVLTTDLRYWSLVFPMLVASFFAESAIFLIAKWRPGFEFDTNSFRYLFRYGINGLGFSITNYLHQNIDYLIVGRLLGTASMGLYEFAYKIPHLVFDRIARQIGGVVFPALSKVQENNERLIAGYVKAVQYIALGSFPILGGLAVLAEPTVTILWGEKWLPIVAPLQILCLCAAIRCVMQPIGSIFLCKDRPDILFKFSLVRLTFTFFIVSVLGYWYGLNGIAVGMLASTLPSMYILYLAFKMTKSSLRKLLRALSIPTAASVASMLCAFGMKEGLGFVGLAQWNILLGSVMTGAIGYIVCVLVMFPDTAKEIWHTISTVLGDTATQGEKIGAKAK